MNNIVITLIENIIASFVKYFSARSVTEQLK